VLCKIAKAAKILASALAAYALPICCGDTHDGSKAESGRPSSVDFHLKTNEPSLQIVFIQPKPLKVATATWAVAHVGGGYQRWMPLAVCSAIACV